MRTLPKTVLSKMNKAYREKYGLNVLLTDTSGRVLNLPHHSHVWNLPIFCKARTDALRESIRWGEPSIFFIAPGAISWMVPIVDGGRTLAGLMGGQVIPQEDDGHLRSALTYLVEAGCSKKQAAQCIEALPHWPQTRVRGAAAFLFEQLYTLSDLKGGVLTRNREHAQQQRQIAETIQEKKLGSNRAYSFAEERALFSLIRVGDRPGARGMLNKMLAAMFLDTPQLTMVQARAIEMMGYLLRAAIENCHSLETLLEYQCDWIARILKTDSFETLCWELRKILNEFMDIIFLQGYNRSNRKVQAIMDTIAKRYTEKLSLEDIAASVNLSHYRIAHLVKECTGKTITQHIRQMRVRKAEEMLLHTDQSYADIAYSLGFSDQSYFIKQFRETTGLTPGKFRHSS